MVNVCTGDLDVNSAGQQVEAGAAAVQQLNNAIPNNMGTGGMTTALPEFVPDSNNMDDQSNNMGNKNFNIDHLNNNQQQILMMNNNNMDQNNVTTENTNNVDNAPATHAVFQNNNQAPIMILTNPANFRMNASDSSNMMQNNESSLMNNQQTSDTSSMMLNTNPSTGMGGENNNNNMGNNGGMQQPMNDGSFIPNVNNNMQLNFGQLSNMNNQQQLNNNQQPQQSFFGNNNNNMEMNNMASGNNMTGVPRAPQPAGVALSFPGMSKEP